MADYDALLRDIDDELDGFIAASVVDLATGMTLTTRTARDDFDLELASAHNSQMVRGKLRTLDALGLSSTLDDMLLTLSDQLHLIKLIDGDAFVYVAAEKNRTNLALLRTAVVLQFRKHGLQLRDL